MKLTKLSLATIAAAGLLSLASTVRAEDPAPAAPTPPPARRGARMSADEQLKNLTEKLKLTAEQQPKVKAAIEEREKARKEVGSLPAEERGVKFKAINEESHKKMKEILTADQFKQYEELQKQMGPGQRRKADGNAPAGGEGAPKKKKTE